MTNMLDKTPIVEGLTDIELAALRQANRVCFYHRPEPDASGFVSYISAIKEYRQSASNPFAGEAIVLIRANFELVEYTPSETGDKIEYGSDKFHAFEMIHAAQVTEEWQTVVGLLRVGDKLKLGWQRGGWTTEAMREASPKFYGDVLRLIVDREKAKRRLVFTVGHCVSENNTARMIRRA